MEQAIFTAVTSVPGIDQVTSGSLRLSQPAVQIVVVTSTSTTTPMSTVGTGAPLMGIAAIVSGVLILVAGISLVTVTVMLRREPRQPTERASPSSEDDLEKQVEVVEQSVNSEKQMEVAEQSVSVSGEDIEMQADVAKQSVGFSI